VDVIQIVVMVMVATIIATITLAAASYAAFRMRERRAPSATFLQADAPVFFERVRFLKSEE
jgi:Tfp pilus assembly protein PilE